jgi:hypothetical protein
LQAIGQITIVGVLMAIAILLSARIDRLERRIDCLEHPHGASSVAVQLRPSYKVIQPATRTGCR